VGGNVGEGGSWFGEDGGTERAQRRGINKNVNGVRGLMSAISLPVLTHTE
jgi:hypothetical protein